MEDRLKPSCRIFEFLVDSISPTVAISLYTSDTSFLQDDDFMNFIIFQVIPTKERVLKMNIDDYDNSFLG